MKAQIDHAPGLESGVLTVRYENLDDLDTLCQLLSRS